MPEYVCLIQHNRFVRENKNVFKIGFTKHKIANKLWNRINFNKIDHLPCEDSGTVIMKAIMLFKDLYNQRKDIGDQYFEGDYASIVYDLRNIIQNELGQNISNDIQKAFPNYIEDECFGGQKQLIKVMIENDFIKIYFISNGILEDEIIRKDWFQRTDVDSNDYLSVLLRTGVITDNAVYDFNDTVFIRTLDRCKEHVTIDFDEEEMLDMINKFHDYKERNRIEYKIDKILCNNCILNKEIYCDSMCNIIRITFPDYDDTSVPTKVKRIGIKNI